MGGERANEVWRGAMKKRAERKKTYINFDDDRGVSLQQLSGTDKFLDVSRKSKLPS